MIVNYYGVGSRVPRRGRARTARPLAARRALPGSGRHVCLFVFGFNRIELISLNSFLLPQLFVKGSAWKIELYIVFALLLQT